MTMTKNTKKPKATAATAPKAATKAEAPKTAPVKAEPAKFAPHTNGPKINHVSLELVKPDAKTVCVAGSFNEWKPEKTPLVSLGNGRWVGDLTVKPGRHEYLFVVDGQWLPDPNARESVANPFGGTNSVLIVSE
jgi:1,4-alpha-glucan branching enzyme